jgi:hypothetical protein
MRSSLWRASGCASSSARFGTYCFSSRYCQLACIRSAGNCASEVCTLRNLWPETRESNPSFLLSVRRAQAARPLAGGSPLAALEQEQILQAQRLNLALRQTRRMNEPSKFRETLALLPCQPEMRPNPSIERTSTGLAHSTPQVYVPLRGPSRFRPAHVKR